METNEGCLVSVSLEAEIASVIYKKFDFRVEHRNASLRGNSSAGYAVKRGKYADRSHQLKIRNVVIPTRKCAAPIRASVIGYARGVTTCLSRAFSFKTNSTWLKEVRLPQT